MTKTYIVGLELEDIFGGEYSKRKRDGMAQPDIFDIHLGDPLN